MGDWNALETHALLWLLVTIWLCSTTATVELAPSVFTVDNQLEET